MSTPTDAFFVDLVKSFTFNPRHSQLFSETFQSVQAFVKSWNRPYFSYSSEIIFQFLGTKKGTNARIPIHFAAFKASRAPGRDLVDRKIQSLSDR